MNGQQRMGGRQNRSRLFVSVLGVLLVYELCKMTGFSLMQMLASVWPGSMSGSGSAPGADAAVWSGLCNLAAQLVSGGVCMLLWHKEIMWGAGARDPLCGRLGKHFPAVSGRTLDYLLLAGAAAGAAVGLNLLISLLQLARLSPAFQETAASQAAVPVWAGILLYGLAAPFSEEVCFRGILYGRVRQSFGPSAGMLFAGILFGLYHGNLVQGLYGAVFGMLLCLVYEKRKSLFAAAFFHGAANLAVYLLFDVWQIGERLTAVAGIGLCAGSLCAAAACFYLCEQ